jgi:hypothetical protein
MASAHQSRWQGSLRRIPRDHCARPGRRPFRRRPVASGVPQRQQTACFAQVSHQQSDRLVRHRVDKRMQLATIRVHASSVGAVLDDGRRVFLSCGGGPSYPWVGPTSCRVVPSDC